MNPQVRGWLPVGFDYRDAEPQVQGLDAGPNAGIEHGDLRRLQHPVGRHRVRSPRYRADIAVCSSSSMAPADHRRRTRRAGVAVCAVALRLSQGGRTATSSLRNTVTRPQHHGSWTRSPPTTDDARARSG